MEQHRIGRVCANPPGNDRGQDRAGEWVGEWVEVIIAPPPAVTQGVVGCSWRPT